MKEWSRYAYLQEQYYVLEVPANCFFTEEENELQLRSFQEGLPDAEVKELRKQLTETIAKHEGPRRINVERLYDVETLSLEEEYKEYYIGEDGLSHYRVMVPHYLTNDCVRLLKTDMISTEFESEFSRVCNIKTNDFFVNKITIKWKSVDLMQQIINNGVIVPIKKNGIVEDRLFEFYGASAGQLRKKMFIMMDKKYIDAYQKVLLCGLNPEVINNSGKKMNVSKFLAYNSLGMTASERLLNPDGTKFDIRRCIVVPDFELTMSLNVDNITPEDVKTELKNDIDCTACDGQGIITRRDVMPHGIDTAIFRVNGGFKGLCSYFPVLEFCEQYGIAPVVKDLWGKYWNIKEDNIDIIFSASQFKLAKYFHSWEEYCEAFDKYDCYICFLLANPDEEDETYSDINYQLIQPLMTMTDEDIESLLQYQIKQIQDMCSDKGTMLNCIGADSKSDKARARAVAAYPELIKLSEFRSDLLDGIKAKIESAKSSKFMLGKRGEDNKRLFVVKDMYAWCERLFLGVENPTGIIPAEHVACKPIANKHKECALGRSPGLALDEVIARVIPNENKVPAVNDVYYWCRTDCVYVSIHDYFYLNLNFDMDGDQLNVITDETYINALKRTLAFFDFEHRGNYYPGTKAAGNDLNNETFANSIVFASTANIGEVSNAMTKIWNSTEFVNEVNKKLSGRKYKQDIIDMYIKSTKFHLLAAQMNIDAAKNMFIPDLPEETVAIMEKTAGSAKHRKKMPYWFMFSKNFKTNEDNRELNDSEKLKKVADANDSVCNRICKYVDDKMRLLNILNSNDRLDLNLSWARGYDYRIFYGENSSIERKKSIIEVWKTQCQRFSFSRIKKENAKEAAVAKTTTDKIKSKKIIAAIRALGYDDDTIYYTLVDFLFKDNAFDGACGSNKYFWLSEFGDRAASIIQSNVKSGHYNKEGSDVDRFRRRCSCCGMFFTVRSLLTREQSACQICSMSKESKKKNEQHKKKRDSFKEENLIKFTDFLKENAASEEDVYKYIIENNIKYQENPESNTRINTRTARELLLSLGYDSILDKSLKYIQRKISIN